MAHNKRWSRHSKLHPDLRQALKRLKLERPVKKIILGHPLRFRHKYKPGTLIELRRTAGEVSYRSYDSLGSREVHIVFAKQREHDDPSR